MAPACSIFAALSDPIRLRCVVLMVKAGELCVCELVRALEVVQPKVSRHLAALREAGLVRDRRDAQWIRYSIAPDLPPWVHEVLKATSEGLASDPIHAADLRRLAAVIERSRRYHAA